MEATTKTVQDLAKRYLVLKDRRSKIDEEMEEIKKALISIMDGSDVDTLEGRTWKVTYSTYFTNRMSKSAVERIIGAQNMHRVMLQSTSSRFTVTRINHKKS